MEKFTIGKFNFEVCVQEAKLDQHVWLRAMPIVQPDTRWFVTHSIPVCLGLTATDEQIYNAALKYVEAQELDEKPRKTISAMPDFETLLRMEDEDWGKAGGKYDAYGYEYDYEKPFDHGF